MKSQIDRLIEIIREKSFKVSETPFKLKSGGISNLYFDMKPTMLDGEGGTLVGELLFDRIRNDLPDFVSGPAVGAVPIIPSVTAAAWRNGTILQGTYVNPKDHGIKNPIQGLVKGQSVKGKTFIVFEDVTTTGGSGLTAVDAITAEGGIVKKVISLTNRDEGAAQLFAQRGIPFDWLVHKHDVIEPAQELFIPADKVTEWEASQQR